MRQSKRGSDGKRRNCARRGTAKMTRLSRRCYSPDSTRNNNAPNWRPSNEALPQRRSLSLLLRTGLAPSVDWPRLFGTRSRRCLARLAGLAPSYTTPGLFAERAGNLSKCVGRLEKRFLSRSPARHAPLFFQVLPDFVLCLLRYTALYASTSRHHERPARISPCRLGCEMCARSFLLRKTSYTLCPFLECAVLNSCR